uniref:DUF3700 domain-containing protein n=1 Tax=Heterorhabditis bacteriophora TaxID=37862 RepID=A0A1I7XE02_HETBA
MGLYGHKSNLSKKVMHSSGNPYISDTEITSTSMRGPAQRRLERLFNNQPEPSPSEGRKKSAQQVWDKNTDLEPRRF